MNHGLPKAGDQLVRPRTGYFLAPDAIFDLQHHLPSEKRLSTHEISVWAALWRHADRELTSFPSHDTLATETGQGVRRVQMALARLIKDGHVRVKSGKAAGRSNVYILVIPPQVHSRRRDRGLHDMRTPSSARGAEQVGTTHRPSSAPRADEGSTVVRNAHGRVETALHLLSQKDQDLVHSWVQSITRESSKSQRAKRTEEAIDELRWRLKRPEHDIRALMQEAADPTEQRRAELEAMLP